MISDFGLCFEAKTVYVTFFRESVFVGPFGLPDVLVCSVSRSFEENEILFFVFDAAPFVVDTVCLAPV